MGIKNMNFKKWGRHLLDFGGIYGMAALILYFLIYIQIFTLIEFWIMMGIFFIFAWAIYGLETWAKQGMKDD